jgi:hypothetical protein
MFPHGPKSGSFRYFNLLTNSFFPLGNTLIIKGIENITMKKTCFSIKLMLYSLKQTKHEKTHLL